MSLWFQHGVQPENHFKKQPTYFRSAVRLSEFEKLLFLVSPGIMNILPVVGPLAIRIRSLPVALQFLFQFGVPFGILFPIVGTCTIPKAVSRLSFVISWRAPRRNDFLAGRLTMSSSPA